MLRVFPHNATNFEGNGLGVLNTAKNVLITRELNGEFRLSFSLPVDDGKWQYLKQGNIVVCDGQLFRIYRKGRQKQGTINRTVDCLHIIVDASQKHIPYFAPMLGQTPRAIMLQAFQGTLFNVMTEAAVNALGMSWVTDLTDILELSKATPSKIIKTLIESLNKGELYIDNYNIALVNRIGRDTGLQCTLSNNLKSLGDDEDGENIINRLYAYGKDDLPLSAPGYIDSPESISLFGLREGYMDFDTVEDPVELLEKAQWQFSPDNVLRIDIPKLSYTIGLIELSKIYGNNFKVSIGDSLIVKDSMLGINTTQRIVKYEYYPYSPQQSNITLGRPIQTYGDLIRSSANTSAQYNRTINQNGKLKTPWMENLIKNLQQVVYDGLKKELTLHKTGDLWEFGNNTAIAIVDGVLAIANKRNPDGTWNFRAFGDGDGFTADEIVAGILKGIKIQQISDLGVLLMEVFKDINGGVIKIYDINGKLNVKMGSEGASGSNMGGTLLLYADAPPGIDPKDYMRIGIAIDSETQSGVISLRNGNNVRQIQLEGDGGIFLFDSNGVQKGYITSTYGYLNNQMIATQDWVQGWSAPVSHSHSNYVTATDLLAAMQNYALASHSHSEYATASDVLNAVNNAINTHIEQYHTS